jgi:hypothetical protein
LLGCPPLQNVAATTIAALRWLGAKDHTFIYWDDASRTYQPTPFGKAVLASGLPPEQCLVLKASCATASCPVAVCSAGRAACMGGLHAVWLLSPHV